MGAPGRLKTTFHARGRSMVDDQTNSSANSASLELSRSLARLLRRHAAKVEALRNAESSYHDVVLVESLRHKGKMKRASEKRIGQPSTRLSMRSSTCRVVRSWSFRGPRMRAFRWRPLALGMKRSSLPIESARATWRRGPTTRCVRPPRGTPCETRQQQPVVLSLRQIDRRRTGDPIYLVEFADAGPLASAECAARQCGSVNGAACRAT